MTDEQIVKALECCGNMNECKKECPLDDLGDIDKCIHTLMLNALDLINRQKAEIEKMAECIVSLNDRLKEKDKAIEFTTKEFVADYKRIKSEEIKEFAERLKEKAISTFYEERKYVDTEDIDELVKEMTEEK
jgi:hypothetical protein